MVQENKDLDIDTRNTIVTTLINGRIGAQDNPKTVIDLQNRALGLVAHLVSGPALGAVLSKEASRHELLQEMAKGNLREETVVKLLFIQNDLSEQQKFTFAKAIKTLDGFFDAADLSQDQAHLAARNSFLKQTYQKNTASKNVLKIILRLKTRT